MSEIEIAPINEQDIEDAAMLFLMSVNAYIGFDKSALELAGASHTILNIAVTELNRQHEQTTASSEVTSSEGAGTEPREVQGSGEPRR
jgi:hypothetical protein